MMLLATRQCDFPFLVIANHVIMLPINLNPTIPVDPFTSVKGYILIAPDTY